MKIWEFEDDLFAVADEGKAFKLDEEYSTQVRILSEQDAEHLVEVYYHNGMEVTEEQHNRLTLLHELKEIREWFAFTDYIPNKVIVGEWAPEDPRFVEYCKKRKDMRARQDEIKNALGYGGLV